MLMLMLKFRSSAMAANPPIPRYFTQPRRFTTQKCWRLWDLALSLSGNIAVSGFNKNTDQTSIEVYSVTNPDSRDKLNIICSKEFEKYEDKNNKYYGRLISFFDPDGLVSCLGNTLEMIQVNKLEVLRSRRVMDAAECLSVRQREIFIGFLSSKTVNVYDAISLSKMKSIILQGIHNDDWPYDVTATADRMFVCVGHASKERSERSLIFDVKKGRILSELTKPTETQWYASSLTICEGLGVVAVVWVSSYYKGEERFQIAFYSMFSEHNVSFLIVDVEIGVRRIRISDRGDNMVTMNYRTGEVKVYDTTELFTYGNLKECLGSMLNKKECVRLAKFFPLSKEQIDIIEKTGTRAEILLLALEEKGVLQECNVGRLTEAFHKLKLRSCCSHVMDFYQKTRRSSSVNEAMSDLTESFKLMNGQSETTTDRQETASKRVETPWTCHRASDGRIYDYYSVTKQPTWENPESLQRKAKSLPAGKDEYVNLSTTQSEFLQESLFEDEFAKLSVRVSEKLTKANCVKLATYFNFPVNKTDLVRNDVETPGITLFDIMKERNIVDKDNVTDLKEALEELDLIDITENLVIPYQRKIDRLKFQREYFK